MALNFKQFFEGIRVKAKSVLTSDTKGELEVDSVSGKLNYHNGTLRSPVVTESTATASLVGLGNVNNTSDANKPVSTAQQSALDLKAPIASPTFTGTVSGISPTMVGLSNVDNTSDANKPVSSAQATAIGLKANIASPTFTGTVSGITSTMVGLGNVDNTSDATKNAAAVTLTNKIITGADIRTPVRLDMKQDTKVNLTTYASTASDGQFVFATDTKETFVIKSSALAPVGGGGIDAWVTSHAYVIGDKVEINNRLYKALTAHTSGTFATDLAANDWIRLDNQATDLTGIVPVVNGGTGSSTQNFVDLSTNQTVAGIKTFSSTIVGSVNGNAATVTTNANLTGMVTSVGNTATVVTNANLTGPITSVGNATSITNSSIDLTTKVTGALPIANGGTGQTAKTAAFDALQPMTTAGDTIYGGTSGTGTRLAIGTQNQVLMVKSGVPAWGNYDPSNMLLNPSFENATVGTSWTLGTNVTITATTTSTNIADPSGTQAGLVTTSATVPFDIHQDITPPSGLAGTQGELNWWLNVPAGITDGQVCPRVNGVVLTNYCISTFNDGAYHQYKIPFVFGTAGQTAGVQFKTTASYASGTQTVIVDLATLKAGLSSVGNLQLDNIYSATIDSSGNITNSTKVFLASPCSLSGTNNYRKICNFNAGIFTSIPNCQAVSTVSGGTVAISSSSTTSLQVDTFSTANTALTSGFILTCQKSGNDYLASSSAVYSQASANTTRTAFTPSSYQGLGTPSSVDCYYSRNGDSADIDCSLVPGTVTASEMRVGLPTGLTSSSLGSIRIAGAAEGYAGALAVIVPLIEPSVTYITFGVNYSTNNPITKILGNAIIGSGNVLSFKVKIPIQGWSNSAQIVGSFAGYTNVPGYQGNVDSFIFNYGTGAASTVCSASPCSYIDQIGSAVTSMTRSSTGNYIVNTTRTYSKLKCIPQMGTTTGGSLGLFYGLSSCSNCSSFQIQSYTTASAAADSYGQVYCQGSY